MPKIIGISGYIGSGKTLLADTLCSKYNFIRVKMAQPLKTMLESIGLTQDNIEGSTKQTPLPLLCNQTPRYAMQTLGTEWGRNLMGADLWVNLWAKKVNELISKDINIVCDDVRFINEVQKIKELGGKIFRLDRAAAKKQDHKTEQQDFKVDILLSNNGDIQDVVQRVMESYD
jgi:hypothetical protein